MKKIFLTASMVAIIATASAMPYNIAPQSKVTASSVLNEGYNAANIVDGKIRISQQREWRTSSCETFLELWLGDRPNMNWGIR